jgi:hypothetical protein
MKNLEQQQTLKDLQNRIDEANTKSSLLVCMTEVILSCQTYVELLKIMLVIDKRAKNNDIPKGVANTLIIFVEMQMEELEKKHLNNLNIKKGA